MTPAKAALEARPTEEPSERAEVVVPESIPFPSYFEHTSLAEALVGAQAEMPAVEKDSVNPHFKSKFVSLDHLIAKTRPVLNRHGLSISQWPTYIRAHGGDDQAPLPALETVISHVSGTTMESTMPLILGKNDMQGLGSALTYAKRYAWAAALGISTDEDDDGNAASRPEVNPQKATGARRSASQRSATQIAGDEAHSPGSDSVSAPATAEEIEAYKAELLAAGFEWNGLPEGVSADEVARFRTGLAAHVAQKAAEASA